jgi:hypothetical protein
MSLAPSCQPRSPAPGPRSRAWWGVVGLVLSLVFAAAPTSAELPQAEPWQRTLRTFLASLGERDVAIEVVPVQYIEEQLDDDARYRDWLLLGSGLWRRPGSPEQPNIDAIRHPADVYLLASIERDSSVWMSPRQYPPMAPAWWSSWAYPGNPYFGSRACKLRGFIPAAVDMMMLVGDGPSADTTVPATNLLANTYAYLHALDVLPNEVRQAFETAIGLALSRLEEPTDASPSGADIAPRAIAACAYVARAVDDAEIATRAETLARAFLDHHLTAAGHPDHGGGYDPATAGSSFYFLTWAALAAPEEWEFLTDAVATMADLETHLLLPEPGSSLAFGPTHFAPWTSADGFQDQAAHRHRDVGAAMLATPGVCLLFQDRPRQAGSAVPKPVAAMEEEIVEAFRPGADLRSVNALLAMPHDPAPTARWTRGDSQLSIVPYDHDYYRPGTLDRFRRAAGKPLSRFPFGRDEDFVRSFGEEFLSAKVGSVGVIVHTGPTVAGPGATGFSGGALSAFWTRDTGAVILGRSHHRPTEQEAQDRWANWWQWQTHALAGVGANGKPFSTARLPREAFTECSHDIGLDQATVRVVAPLRSDGDRGSDAAPDGALVGRVFYTRTFDVDAAGLRIETSIEGDGRDRVTRLYEILPIFNAAPVDRVVAAPAVATVYFDVGRGWKPAADKPVTGVRRIRVDRHEGAVVIEFDRPQTVGLAEEAGPSCHNLLIDLLRNDGEPTELTTAGVAYTIRPLLERR